MSAGLVFSSIANSFHLLIFTYGCVGGLGSGSMWMPTSYVVFNSFDQASIKRVTGFVSAGTAIGLLIFPPLENYLIVVWSIQSAFLIVGVIVFAFTILAYQTSRNSRVASGFAFGEAFRRLKTKRFGFLYVYYSAGNAFSRTLVTIFLVPLLESRGLGTAPGTIALVLIGVGSLAGRLTAGVKSFNEETMAAIGFILQGGLRSRVVRSRQCCNDRSSLSAFRNRLWNLHTRVRALDSKVLRRGPLRQNLRGSTDKLRDRRVYRPGLRRNLSLIFGRISSRLPASSSCEPGSRSPPAYRRQEEEPLGIRSSFLRLV